MFDTLYFKELCVLCELGDEEEEKVELGAWSAL